MNSWLKWFGGKNYCLDFLLPFPYHTEYIEVFGGGASVLLNKIPSEIEIYNDINSRLVNAWKVLQQSYLWFQVRGQFEIESRTFFEDYKKPSLNEFEDAFRFFYVNRMSFSGNNDSFLGFHELHQFQS